MNARRGDWRADDCFVLRTPLLGLSAFLEWGARGDLAAARRYLMELTARPEIEEALYVASVNLHAALAGWRANPETEASQRVELSLVKYLARMMGRSTPFGLFSGVSTGRIGKETRLELAPRSAYQRRTRLDNDYLFVLLAALAGSPEGRERLVVKPNTSIYRTAGRIRYAVAKLAGRERRYDLVSVSPTPYLDATLERAASGARLAELAAALVDTEITLPEARAYIDELVAAQLLVPELGVHVTGPEPLDGAIAQLATAGLDAPRTVLEGVRGAIEALDASGVGSSPERYRQIAASLEVLPAKVDASLLFQVDMVKPSDAMLGAKVIGDVSAAIGTLAQIFRYGAGLDEFRKAFMARYEDREMPLATVLDEESGIGFEAVKGPGAEGAPLLGGLAFPGVPGEPRTAWGRAPQFLVRRHAELMASGATELELTDKDVAAMSTDAPAALPDSFGTMIRLAIDPATGDHQFMLDGISGPSGTRLLGRFCHASPAIDTAVRAHCAAEAALRPDAVFAEIAHLNEGRIGNIVCRPVLRTHEIVYLGHSGAPAEQQIHIDDLTVSVRDGRIVLRSKRLGKEVIPRNSTAHNYRLRSLGAYRFLSALASEGTESTGWSWGVLDSAPFLPRVRRGKAIFARAMWNLGEADLAAITAAVKPNDRTAIATAVAALRTARRLPRFVALASGDNELPIDLENPLLVNALAHEIAGARGARLIELFPTPDQLPVSGPEGRFTNEIALMFTRTKPPVTAVAPTVAPATRRSFGPGSEWLYAKIYCGESTADRVLRDALAPVVREAIASGAATHWFFVRYGDPDHHVRIRLAGDPARLAGTVLPALDRALAPLIAEGAVRKLVLDTYDREIERYGGDRAVELVEQIFWRDSEAVLGCVELLDGDAGADARWRLALRGIDSFFSALGLDEEQKRQIATTAKESLGHEYRANTPFWTRVGDKFARERASLESMLATDHLREPDHDLAPGFELLAARDAAIAELAVELRRRDEAGELSPRIVDFAWSIAHMYANRILHASQRAQELVLYDFLRRLYAGRKARAKGTAKPPTA